MTQDSPTDVQAAPDRMDGHQHFVVFTVRTLEFLLDGGQSIDVVPMGYDLSEENLAMH